MGLIYKITNPLDNNRSYIGQTRGTLEKRWYKHTTTHINYDDYFHRAIRKYGSENFIVEVLEENIPEELLNEKEAYYIEKYNTYIKNLNSNGYNLTRGGDFHFQDIHCSLSPQQVKEIKELLKNTDLAEKEIGEMYDVTIYAISDINRGKSWHDDNIEYPIQLYQTREITYQEFCSVIELLQTNMFSSQWIAQKLDIGSNIVSKINTGKYKKFSYPSNIAFPIQRYKNVSNKTKITVKQKIQLLIYFLENNLSIDKQKVSQELSISKSYINNIIRNQNHPHYLDDIAFPLTLHNKDQNLQLLYKKIDILNKYDA